MKEIYATLNEVVYDFKEEYENIEMVVYSLVAFAIPLLFPHPQLLTGTLVNAFLIMAALHFRGWKVLPLVIFPSIAAVLNGILFGPFTIFLLYMMPFIWVGNFVLIYLFKKLHIIKGANYFIALVISALGKAAFLFVAAYILVAINILPPMFLTAMGVVQLGTAILGGIIAFGMRSIYFHLVS